VGEGGRRGLLTVSARMVGMGQSTQSVSSGGL
jgi:hypothetical protein